MIVRRQIEGLFYAEIAHRLGRSEDSVQKLWMRGLKALRRLMNRSERSTGCEGGNVGQPDFCAIEVTVGKSFQVPMTKPCEFGTQ
jgi:hypothetical protein